MADRFCSSCGVRLLSGANFCAECGEGVAGGKAASAPVSISWQRYAPVLVVLVVLAVAAGAISIGMLSPKSAPNVPRHDAPQANPAAGNLPAGHPPITLPEEVKQAIRDLQAKAQAAPDDMDAWKRLAEVQYRSSQLDPTYLQSAADSYTHILDHEPENLDAIRSLGNIAFDQDRADDAVTYYQRYLKQKPDDLDVQTDLGTMYLSSGKPSEAIQQYEQVLKTNPKFFQAQFNLAIAYRQLEQPAQMLAALEKSRDLAPDDKTRNQVERMLAGAKGEAPPPSDASAPAAPMAPAPAAPASSAPAGSFQADAEGVFRGNQILGPKVGRIEWAGAETAKVYLNGFPMDQMPDEMKTMFSDRMKERIKEKKGAHQITAVTTFELVDAATGKVMATITE